MRAVFVVVLSGRAVLGCSPSFSSAGADVGEAGLTTGQACTDVASARCKRIATCTPGSLQYDYGSMAACLTNYQAACLTALAAPSTGATPESDEACAQAIPGWSCADYNNDQNVPSACVQRTGSLGNGTGCVASAQCQSGFCAFGLDALCGTCAPVPTAGADCTNLTSCGQSLLCSREVVPNTCVSPGALHAPCNGAAPCGYSLSCVGATSTAMGTCQPGGTSVGAACDPKQLTAPGCPEATGLFDTNYGLYCNVATNQCEAVTFGTPGQACGLVGDGGVRVACPGAGRCLRTSDGGPALCVEPAQEGMECATQNGPGCLDPDRCITDAGTSEAGAAGSCLPTTVASCP